MIYRRVSKEEQAREGISLDVQYKRLRQFAKDNDMIVVGDYEDAGKSAKDTNREGLQRLLRDAERKKFDVILTLKIDRISRSSRDFVHLLEHFEKNDINLISITEHFDPTTAMGKAMREMAIVFAELERGMISERIKTVVVRIMEEGRYSGGEITYGYKWVGKRKPLIIEPKEASIVKKIFKLARKRMSLCKIAEYLNNRGLLNRDGKHWTYQRLLHILRNPTYIGKKRIWGDVKSEKE